MQMAVVTVPNKILTSDTYHDEIRDRLGVTEDIISDTSIDAVSVLPIAEARVIESVPDYDSLTGDDSNYVYAAAICMVAAILAPSMAARIKKSKKDFDFSFENQAIDWSKRSIGLVDEAFEFIGSISTQPTSDLSIMGVSGPTRSKSPLYGQAIRDGDITL